MPKKRQTPVKTKSAPKGSESTSKMGKVVNFYSVGLICSLSMAFVAYNYGGTSVEDVSEQIALRLLEILPRKQQEHREAFQAQHTPTEAPEVNAPRQHENESSSDAPLLSKESTFNPVGYYNAKQAMEKRYEGLREVCLKYSDFMRPERSITKEEPTLDRYLYDPESEFAMCNLDRVAKSSWSTFFARGFSTGAANDNKRSSFKNLFPKSLSTTKRAIMVRHPLERLVSAYRSKYEKSFNVNTNQEEGGEITFQDFIDVVLRGPLEYAEFLEENNLHGQSIAIDTGMIDGKGDSAAWNPFWKQCGVCNPTHQPQYILHMDHFKEDAIVLTELFGNRENHLAWVKTTWTPKSGIREVEEHYFSQLTKSEIRELHDKYRIDHELFGFTPDYYIAMGQDD